MNKIYRKYIKRILDLLIAIPSLIIISPLFLIIWFLVKLEEPQSPAIFRQVRCGKHKKPFEMYKFRSMSSSAPKNKSTREFKDSDKYISKLGRFIRLTSIDELPQIINIIKGDMSFVGPRPVIYEEVQLIKAREEVGAYEILPGITGFAQINGRDEIDIVKKAEYDGEYFRRMNIITDTYLSFMSIPIVLLRKGHKDNGK
ncbi:sugar transferase [Microaceticoccus formicicus]|uniref:sugar transferase n=1 Tax=Microaceticoccus formicicus TaxID=3118105 RepID=UPI003CD0080E|nr:sugar transferase [Peptoniphilaceae bacterium AMB_02]